MNKEIEDIKKQIMPLLKQYNVTKAGIFGSYARGEQKKKSDVDILVEINDPDMGLIKFIHLKILLEKTIGRKVDLVEYGCIRKEIRENVLIDEVRIIA